MLRKLLFIGVFVLCLQCMIDAPVAAETGFGFHLGYVKSSSMDSGFYVGGQTRFRLSPAFGFEIALDYRDQKSDQTIEYKGVVTNASTLARSYPLTGTMIFTLFAEKRVPLNLLGGVGMYYYTLTFKPEGFKSKTEHDVRFGYHLGAGTEMPVSQGVRFDAAAKYLFLDLKDEYGDVVLSEQKANAFMLSAGLTFYF